MAAILGFQTTWLLSISSVARPPALRQSLAFCCSPPVHRPHNGGPPGQQKGRLSRPQAHQIHRPRRRGEHEDVRRRAQRRRVLPHQRARALCRRRHHKTARAGRSRQHPHPNAYPCRSPFLRGPPAHQSARHGHPRQDRHLREVHHRADEHGGIRGACEWSRRVRQHLAGPSAEQGTGPEHGTLQEEETRQAPPPRAGTNRGQGRQPCPSAGRWRPRGGCAEEQRDGCAGEAGARVHQAATNTGAARIVLDAVFARPRQRRSPRRTQTRTRIRARTRAPRCRTRACPASPCPPPPTSTPP
ncbi:hypothetical protein PHLGIDRAFT_302991 [Phlebiopsis gigantea 11061_1 CR5-6]|uniref:Uncharacterized protein n=1 Tax=Phlebiopsis gigantea (strain 11061_1 CR5-6) TaxID=745531 RepID=A0A0C3S2Z1_PHLG1|nr:hypothetical protein PHLGIDRAFT_302991 [Phlebiopsis gigantea 11061_1 CR5-6]